MSSDDYFDDELDSVFLKEVDALEAAHAQAAQAAKAPPPPPQRVPVAPRPIAHEVIELDDTDEFSDFEVNEADIQAIDLACSNAASRRTMGTVQTTLFGGRVPVKTKSLTLPSSKPRAPHSDHDRSQPKKTKQWDHTAFAKTGWKNPKPKGKGKGRAMSDEGEDEDWDSPTEFEQFPAPSVNLSPILPMKLVSDPLSTKRWIYPLNQPKRDYQFNIVKRSLYHNTLVALPTGLGKTFIAGCVMLNYYTWFPEGKVVFVAPTKPLVAQQIEACHQTCGIPGSDAISLTGQDARAVRARHWQDKRVFYMTPQTLMNDLRTENCDPRDIVLIVIDEAHKGTGDYAYAQVIRYMMAKNPHFRVLALTATPGSKPEAVQEIVDALHISRIEIRDERSMDITPYMHQKAVQQHFIAMTDDYRAVIDLLSPVLHPLIQRVAHLNLLKGNPTPTTLQPFTCIDAISQAHNRRDKPTWAVKILSKLNGLSRAMGYLVCYSVILSEQVFSLTKSQIEQSMSACYSTLNDINTGAKSSGDKGKGKPDKKRQQDPQLQAVMKELERHKGTGFPPHPKMDRLKALLYQHFIGDAPGDQEHDSRVMVFATFRDTVDEIVDTVNEAQPTIRAHRFVGQGTDKKSRKGFTQKEQLEVIQKFRKGEYNVLVSTSIGEEGLDIGEVDMIVCYDAQKAPIRMLQRVGRTGRKRDGSVHVLLAEGREERNWDKAVDNYRKVQSFIVDACELELYDDVYRLIPENIKPECLEIVMPIEPYVREEPKPKSSKAVSKTAKKGRDIRRNIPEGALTTFISASKLKRKKLPEFDEHAADSDEEDKDIEAGLFGPRRTVSMTTTKAKKQTKLRRVKTDAVSSSRKESTKVASGSRKPTSKTSKTRMPSPPEEFCSDSDDQAIEQGLFNFKPTALTKTPPRKRRVISRSSSPEIPLASDVIDLVTPNESKCMPSLPISSPDPLFSLAPSVGKGISRETCKAKEIPSTPPEPNADQQECKSDTTEDDDDDIGWLVAADSEPDLLVMPSSPIPIDNKPEVDGLEVVEDSEPELSLPGSPVKPPLSPEIPINDGARMPPPALPSRLSHPSPDRSFDVMPEPTFAVRGPGKHPRKRLLPVDTDSSPAMPPPSQRRLQRYKSPTSPIPKSPAKKRRKRVFKDAAEAQKYNPWIDLEAGQSGDENGLGSSDVELMASESDLQFLEELPETQASPSYDQSAVYRRSLFTQAPGGTSAEPMFAKRPTRRGAQRYFNETSPVAARKFSSPSKTDPESDDYVFGSFVVDDDADISYTDDT